MLDTIVEKINKHKALLVAVSKTKSAEQILEIYHKGFRHFGENRAKELQEKAALLPKDIIWHMIGHLQKNKVKYIAECSSYIHSVDSLELLQAINKQALKHDKIIKVMLQLKIGKEETKYGLNLEQAQELIRNMKGLNNVTISGVMGMATFTDDTDQVRKEFSELKSSFDFLKSNYFEHSNSFKEISMGMSGDYEIALDEGATMVRIGSLIFGSRN